MQPNFTGGGCVPQHVLGPEMTQRVRRHRGRLLVEPRPGVDPLERANRRRGGMTLYFKKKRVRLAHHTVATCRQFLARRAGQCSHSTVRAPPHCTLPISKESHRGRGRYHVITNSREFCNYEGDVLGAFTVEE